MWKTLELESARCHLWPTCDSLGPHLAWHDEDKDKVGSTASTVGRRFDV